MSTLNSPHIFYEAFDENIDDIIKKKVIYYFNKNIIKNVTKTIYLKNYNNDKLNRCDQQLQCNICFESGIKVYNINNCCNETLCENCFTKIFSYNKLEIVCPYCRRIHDDRYMLYIKISNMLTSSYDNIHMDFLNYLFFYLLQDYVDKNNKNWHVDSIYEGEILICFKVDNIPIKFHIGFNDKYYNKIILHNFEILKPSKTNKFSHLRSKSNKIKDSILINFLNIKDKIYYVNNFYNLTEQIQQLENKFNFL